MTTKLLDANERMVPADGANPYAEHPGFDASNCSLRDTVTQRGTYGGVRGGFRCQMTGGHCLPGERCDDLRQRAAESDAAEQAFRAAHEKYAAAGKELAAPGN